jgi:hypothetical protein
LDHTDNHQVRKAEPELDLYADQSGAAKQSSGAQVEALPSWLGPGAKPAPAGHWGRPLYAWGGTLTATALMVAFGLWLGNEPAPLAQQIAATPSAPVAVPQARESVSESATVPPLVLLPTPAQTTPPTPVAPVRLAQHTVAKPKAQGKMGTVFRKPAVTAKSRTTTLAARAQVKPRAGATASPLSQGWSSRVAALDSGNGRRMRCKRGELARECLARYR